MLTSYCLYPFGFCKKSIPRKFYYSNSIVAYWEASNFSGQVINKKRNLKWASSTENNFSHYEIEKSADGRNFYKVGSVTGRNNSSPAVYGFIDSDDINTDAYYRFKIIGSNGLFKYSETILLSNKKSAFAVSGYSNPFHNFISIDYTLPNAGKVSFCIADAYGRTVYLQSLNGKKDLNNSKLKNLDYLAAGIYTITVSFENISITKRAVKIN